MTTETPFSTSTFRLINLFKPLHKEMVDDPVTEISGNDLPHFWSFNYKTDRAGGPICLTGKPFSEVKQVLLCVNLKLHGVDGLSFISPALEITPVEVLE